MRINCGLQSTCKTRTKHVKPRFVQRSQPSARGSTRLAAIQNLPHAPIPSTNHTHMAAPRTHPFHQQHSPGCPPSHQPHLPGCPPPPTTLTWLPPPHQPHAPGCPPPTSHTHLAAPPPPATLTWLPPPSCLLQSLHFMPATGSEPLTRLMFKITGEGSRHGLVLGVGGGQAWVLGFGSEPLTRLMLKITGGGSRHGL